MKKGTIFIAIALLLIGGDVSAKNGNGWKKFGKFLGGMASAAAGAVIEQAVEHSGYKPEEAKQMTHDFIENLGLNTANVDRGLDYITASDKYARQNVVANFVFDEAIESSSNSAVLTAIKGMSDAQFTYLSESKKATTQEEKQAAFDTRTRRYAEISYDAYELAKQRKAQRLSEELQIKQQLIRNGNSPEFADEVAGTILAVQSSKDMSEKEKQDYLRVFGFIQTPEEIEKVAETILNTEEDQLQVPVSPTPEEIAAKEEAERLEKERIAKENAIESVNITIINEYMFDDTDLNDEQKESLDKIAEVLIKYSDLSLQIKGHTCSIGYKSVNDRVGLRRADTAKAYLVAKGISADRISTITGGENEPIVENNSNENRKQNRRLAFTIQ